MGTVSGPFLIIRNLSVLFDDDTFAFPPSREEDLLNAMVFLNRMDSLDAVKAVFEDIEAAEDDAVLNMTTMICFSLPIYFSLLRKKRFFSSSLSLSLSLSCELSLFLSLSLSLSVCVCVCSFVLFFSPDAARAIGGVFLPSLFCSRVVFCKAFFFESSIPFPEIFNRILVMFCS